MLDFKESIELRNLSFYYDKRNQIFNKINLKIKKEKELELLVYQVQEKQH